MDAPPRPDVTTAALAWCAAGCSVVRVSVDGSKAPLGAWTGAPSPRAAADTVRTWFHGGHPGVGVVCGGVSGHLEMLAIEGRAVTDGTAGTFLAALTEHGLGHITEHILTGYSETSPSGGVHFFYRVTGGESRGNLKLAQRSTADGVVPLLETRGEGGFVVVAPSHGPVHPSGRAWTVFRGDPAGIATITAEERDALHDVARTLDELPPPEPIPDPVPIGTSGGGVRPGDDYNGRATWDEI